MRRQLLIIHHKEKVMTRLMKEFLKFCQSMTNQGISNHNLSSPRALQTILTRYEQSMKEDETE
jgi:hypothetical protein